MPAVEGYELAFLVDPVDGDAVADQAARDAAAIEAQPDEIAVEPDDAAKGFALVPVERHCILKPFALQEFLALEQHWDAGCSEH